MLTCPSASGLSIDTTLALLLVRKEAGEDVIDLSEMSLQQADEDVRTGHIGTALIKRQFEQYKYKDLTPGELHKFKTFVGASFGGIAFVNLSRALALLADQALDKKALLKLRMQCHNWDSMDARVEFFQSHPGWLVPILRHPDAHTNYEVAEKVMAAVANTQQLITTDATNLAKQNSLMTIAQLATLLTRARPLKRSE